MKTKILHNPSEKDIIDYKIEEAVVGQDGEPVYEESGTRPKWTGKTYEWSIKAGENVEFPAYVADYLKQIYGFLEEGEVKEVKEEVKEAQPIEVVKTDLTPNSYKAKRLEDGQMACPFCGKVFKNQRAVALHIGVAHRDKF